MSEKVDLSLFDDHQFTDELLCLARVTPLSSYVKITPPIKYNCGNTKGVYVFWLNNSEDAAKGLFRNLTIKGPGGTTERVVWDWNLEKRFIPIYVGKTRNFKNRLSQHLMLGTSNWEYPDDNSLFKKNTGCQLRAGLEHLYRNSKKSSRPPSSSPEKHSRFMVFDDLYVSFVEVDSFVDRFYLEDFAISVLKPWFNLDSER